MANEYVRLHIFNDLTAIGYLANQRVTVLGNIYQNSELAEGLK